MKAEIIHNGHKFLVDFLKPLDISIPLRAGKENVNAWYTEPVKIEPVRMGEWVGDVNQGGSVNFRNIFFNPHGNGTHTECVGHISRENYSLNQCLKNFFFFARVVSLTPQAMGSDLVFTAEQLQAALHSGDKNIEPQALIIRTLPNIAAKTTHHYSNTNPPYLQPEAIKVLLSHSIEHLLIDLPSIDREQDEGKLASHHAFWEYPERTQWQRTITEMIYVPDEVVDGYYLLNLQIASFENDASPSKPVLYALEIWNSQ